MNKQLELFEVLSAEQEQQKSDAFNRIIKLHKRRMELTQRKKNILLENGFVEGTHFVVEESIKTENVQYEIGYGYNDTRKSFTDKIAFWQNPSKFGLTVDPAKESKRIRKNQALGLPLNKGDIPVIKRKKKAL